MPALTGGMGFFIRRTQKTTTKGFDMAEIRVEVPNEELAVLDGYCSATSANRTDILRGLLKEWSDRKFHEATIILRVAGRNPTVSESDRSATGKAPA